MLAHSLLLFTPMLAILVVQAILIHRQRRDRRILIEVKDQIAEVQRSQIGLRDIGNDTSKEVGVMAKFLDLILTSERAQRQMAASDVCSTGGHRVIRRTNT